MEKVKIGILGLGAISGIYLKNLTELFKEVEVEGIYDLIPEKMEAAKKEYGISKTYSSMEELLEDPAIEIVLNLTRPFEHYDTTKAAVETIAENTSDGVIAPMLYTALGGPVLGFLYKAVNTMDSMVGYKNEKYLYFGRAAARLDDAANFIPSKISACLMIFAAFVGGKRFSGRRAFLVYKRDNRKHASPNSAQTESVCAGALGIQLAGDASYFGKNVKKPYIGDALRKVEYEDIRRANRLMYLTAWMSEGICLILMYISA